MNDYQKEQLETLGKLRGAMKTLSSEKNDRLRRLTSEYMDFRKNTDIFLNDYFGKICTRNCYESDVSACCSKDGIITFFADHAVNAVFSRDADLYEMELKLLQQNHSSKCVYLGKNGCIMKVRPIVCAMFLCEAAVNEVFEKNADAKRSWEKLEARKKDFTWPDKPVLFDELERFFLDMGLDTSLMYCHKSPGLLRLKKKAGI